MAKQSLLRYFNPLPRKEGDVASGTPDVSGCYFNPLPRKEGDGQPW